MTTTDHSNIDKNKFIPFLWNSLHNMAFLDIKRASDGKSKMGAFILSSCFIEYLAGFRYGKETTRDDYKLFISKYFKGKYNPDKLYTDLRCKLVHNYSEGGSYTFIDNRPELHKKETGDGKIILNLENFISDIEIVLKEYFEELKTDDSIFQLAIKRFLLLNILGINPTLILKKTEYK